MAEPQKSDAPSDVPGTDRPSRLRALGLYVADKTVGTVITVLVVIGLAALGIVAATGGSDDADGQTSELSTQWLRERAKIARKGWRIVQRREVDLRGVGEPSTILVLEPPAESCVTSATDRSQQIRIYDVREGKLKRRLTFEPNLEGCPPMNFQFVHVGPLREYDEAPLILGKFSGGVEELSFEISIPVVIAWNARFLRYTLDPLLVRPMRLAEVAYGKGRPLTGLDRDWYRQAEMAFERPVELGQGVRGFAVGGLAFGRSRGMIGGPLIAGVYQLTGGNSGDGSWSTSISSLYQLELWALGTTASGELYAGECSLSDQNVVQGLASEEGMAKKLLEIADALITSCAEY